jgi:uncharacterized protein YukE
VADKTFDVDPEALRGAARSIGTEQGNLQRAVQEFHAARQISAAQGQLDEYNDVIQDVLRATEEAITAFDALAANLGQRTTNLLITASNYQLAQDEATRRYAGLGGGG